ncbi:hypothetical protein H2203_008299 [Taxawa tesnikishii (nom. ined.)]|nr:hypothetical protein H2203_008299 [Dothideales sp. JES 119]
MRFTKPVPLLLPLSSIPSLVSSQSTNGSVDLSWHAPLSSNINSLSSAVNGTGTYGFIFNSSTLPSGVPYGTYDWCNMPHVRASEYPQANSSYTLEYVEVIHRHHKRTPYAANTFPVESYPWYCSDEGLFYYGQPLPSTRGSNTSASTYWSVYTSSSNPLAPQGFNGTCQFPQITVGGLEDSLQHGRDLFGVYHDLLHFLPSSYRSSQVSFRVTNNVITSQVAGMLIAGMYPATASHDVPLLIQPDSIDSLEPAYTCSAASSLYSSYGSGSTAPGWRAHLDAARSLYATLDSISGVSPSASGWHVSFDHYFDNLSARLCHAKPLPCNTSNPSLCVSQAEADEVFRLGEYEYSYIYRDAGAQTLQAAVGSYGIWVAELANNLRHVVSPSAASSTSANDAIKYRHNIAHDGSVSRLLSILQIEKMVWPGMGSEVVFELFKDKKSGKYSVRVLWGGQILKSSNPSLGIMDMVPVETVLAYFDGLVGVSASKIPGLCSAGS